MSRAHEFLRQRDRAVLTLDGADDKVQVHVQAQLEGVRGIASGGGFSGWRS